MATPFYEILLRGDEAGLYRGGHIIATPGAIAHPIGPGLDFEWPDVIADINAAALERVSELEAERSANTEQLGALEASKERIISAARNEEITREQFQAIVEEEDAPRAEKEKSNLRKEIADLQKRLDELDAKGPSKNK